MRVGFTCSAFDLLHAGHVSMLKDAKEKCDYLMVGLHVDPSIERTHKNKPIQTLPERYIQLAAVKYVDEIIPYETEEDLIDILYTQKVDVRIIGEEYRHAEFTGKAECLEQDIEIYFNDRLHDLSTTELRERIYGSIEEKPEPWKPLGNNSG